MRRRGLTTLQIDALVTLASGWRFGIDPRTVRGLRRRGLVATYRVKMAGGNSVTLPELTAPGAVLARQLRDRAIAESRNVVVLTRQLRGLPMFDGAAQ